MYCIAGLGRGIVVLSNVNKLLRLMHNLDICCKS